MEISDKAIRLILDFEGMDKPDEWPGGASGISIGRGYDLGYESNFTSDWSERLRDSDFARLSEVVGLKGEAAHRASHQLTGIKISEQDADEVFIQVALPRETEKTITAFPNSDKLNPDALGALVSLVFNRGTLIDGSDRRTEMLAIRSLLQRRDPQDADTLNRMADYFESMTRLWPNTRGLRRRRIAEARLIRESIPA